MQFTIFTFYKNVREVCWDILSCKTYIM